MPTTLAQIRTVLGRRLGPYVALADINDAVVYSLRQLGIFPADPSVVGDIEVGMVTDGDLNQLFDVATWRALPTIIANLDVESMKAVGIMEKPEEARLRLERLLQSLTGQMKLLYGVGLPTISAGVVTLDFQQQGTADGLR